jgi:ribosomal protein L11 methyltransferase
VVIDPGMAFGTGHHASTRSCLEMLDFSMRAQQITRALDLGTGSGVLAIALAKLGVLDVWAIDIDPRACAVATANVIRNGVQKHVRIASDLNDVSGTFDLVVANLYADALKSLAGRLAERLEPSGMLICSGLLAGDEDGVRTAYELHGLHVVKHYSEQSWVTLALLREPRP